MLFVILIVRAESCGQLEVLLGSNPRFVGIVEFLLKYVNTKWVGYYCRMPIVTGQNVEFMSVVFLPWAALFQDYAVLGLV